MSILSEQIQAISRDKNIDPRTIIEALQDAVTAAARRHFKSNENLVAIYSEESHRMELYAAKRVTDVVVSPETEVSLEEALQADETAEIGDVLYEPRQDRFEELGRIAAQTAKQIIVQKVREAERENIYNEYIGRVGEIVHGVVKRFERGNIILDIGRTEALLPRSEQSPAENFSQNDRVRVVITQVTKDAKGPQVHVSRTSPELLKRLFEMEVPEIYDGTVTIKAAAREPGERAKVGVASNDPDVDPVGACVGMKGSRVQAVIRELRGEKIDIIPWSEDPVVFAANALSPAKVSRVQITDFTNQRLEVIVEESQLSLAIGKRGQNVRLASKLVGWNIDIRSDAEMKREVASQFQSLLSRPDVPLTDLTTLNPAYAQYLQKAGIATLEELADANLNDVASILDISFDEAVALIEQARQLLPPPDTDETSASESTSETAEVEAAPEHEAGAEATPEGTADVSLQSAATADAPTSTDTTAAPAAAAPGHPATDAIAPEGEPEPQPGA
ncbi:transcription termination factor NusA [Chloracidobacterium aggregatum]|uniref:Transcription termination/antitermination protein NusA n=1 Tax=Chloracidobacterium sp. N TaxID=2821540 RepID=A0ABX8B2Y8_9BACT|nr:transcription termination factor NusA [Chloracidobacterium aggregatum]QUV85267.1 transcription termination/antitermination protein NusA [Chloracidobacterium sp. 2]QUV88331.1 transcription termination/antitermination protein NusA [Chloracidobacterium sp. S]QUV91251.1 transcription termination/antitermination protein NusA [Chloracidobacterium sp. A]QUV94432.1 transcription termination/antitermination protein NusA [Chloracidobacterium sp. N]